MKKLITWLGDTLNIFKILFIIFFLSFSPSLVQSSERWVLDKTLSTIEFELPVLFAKNVQGKFKTI